jgi:homocysteine S-methyltransferase
MDEGAWVGVANLTHTDVLTRIHADYIAAGADVITTNTFASSRLMLGSAGKAGRVRDGVRAATTAAFRARDQAAGGRPVAVAGSLSHMVPFGSDDASPTEAEMLAAFRELAAALADEGCDLLLLEMMYHPVRMKLAVQAALETGLPVWLGTSARAQDGALLSSFHHAAIPFSEVVALVPERGIDVAGVMHTSAATTDAALDALRGRYGGPLMAYPDSGYFEPPHWRFVDVMSTAMFVEHGRRWAQAGVQVLGGCCGLGVEHIEALARADLG